MNNTKFVQAQAFFLAGSGAVLGATSVILASFKDINGTNLAMTDFGSVGYGTIEPGVADKEEQISFTGVTQNANGTATLTGVKTVLFKSPYTESSGLAKTHSGGTTFVISNTAGFYNKLVAKDSDAAITATYTFSATAFPQFASHPAFTNNTEIIDKKYADDLAIAGAPAALNSVPGIVKIATTVQTTATTDSDGTYYYALPVGLTTITSSGAGDSGKVPVLAADGTLASGFIDKARTWSTVQSFTANNAQITTDADSANDAVRQSYALAQVALNTAPGTSGQAFSEYDCLYIKNDGKLYRTDSDDLNTTYPFVGFATETVVAADVATRFVKPGGVTPINDTLTIGSEYYIGGAVGTVSLVAGTIPAKVGVATATDKLLVQTPKFNAIKSGTGSGWNVASVDITTGFVPNKITIMTEGSSGQGSWGVFVKNSDGGTTQFSRGTDDDAVPYTMFSSSAVAAWEEGGNVFTGTISLLPNGFRLTTNNLSTARSFNYIAEYIG